MKKILVIDNYDSFTYNLVYYIEKITGISPSVFRNDEISLDECQMIMIKYFFLPGQEYLLMQEFALIL